jgi:hypothetical protein
MGKKLALLKITMETEHLKELKVQYDEQTGKKRVLNSRDVSYCA